MKARPRLFRRRDHNAFVAANPAHAGGWCPWLIAMGRRSGPPCDACLAIMRPKDRAKWKAYYTPTITTSVADLKARPARVTRPRPAPALGSGPNWPPSGNFTCSWTGCSAPARALAYFPGGKGSFTCAQHEPEALRLNATSMVGVGQ